jgi:hypothetical protein
MQVHEYSDDIPPQLLRNICLQKGRGEATDGWPSGYGASFRISFQSLVFGRGFEPHSIQNLGASVLPVLAVFPFCLYLFSFFTIHCSFSCSTHRFCHPYRGLEIMHIIGSTWRQAIFIDLELQNILLDSGFFPRGFRHLARFLIVLLCQPPIQL